MSILVGDACEQLRELPDSFIQCCVTSPPYFDLRDYAVKGQIGREKTTFEYITSLVCVFEQVRRVLTTDGTLWLNIGDKHIGGEALGIPWTLAFALREYGWRLCMDNIWHKPNPRPESVKTRTTRAHEYVFMMAKSASYYYNADSIREPLSEYYAKTLRKLDGRRPPRPATENFSKERRHISGVRAASTRAERAGFVNPLGANKRSVWTIPNTFYKGAHFAPYPEKLVEPCILAGSRPRDFVLDPFCGSGTTGVVAKRLGREFVGIELNPEYAELAEKRIDGMEHE